MYKTKIILAGILWGFVGLFAHSLVSVGLTVREVSSLRFLFSAIILGIFLLILDKKLFLPRKIFTYFLLGTFNFFTTICYYKCIEYLGGGVACVLLYTTPVVVVCLVAIAYRKPPSKITVLAIVATLLGLMLAGEVFTAKIKGVGFVFGLLSALFNAMVTLIGASGAKRENPLTVNFYSFTFSALLGLFFLKPTTFSHLRLAPNFLMVVALSGICTVLPFSLYIKGLKGCRAEKACVLCALEPIVANLIDCIINSKKPTISLVLGLGSILVSVWLLGIKNKDEKSKKEGKQIDEQILQRGPKRTWQFDYGTKSNRGK